MGHLVAGGYLAGIVGMLLAIPIVASLNQIMNETNGENGGFLQGRHKNCPSCGELMLDNTGRCRFCNWAEGEPVVLLEPHKGRNHLNSHSVNTVEDVPNPVEELSNPVIIREPCYTSDGMCIPSEYGSGFNSRSYSWGALWFADLWYAEKGMTKLALKHFYLRLTATLFGVNSIIYLINTSDISAKNIEKTSTAGGVFIILWFIVFVITAFVAHMDAVKAHMRYIQTYNESLESGECTAQKKRGMTMYWAMLLVPFFIFLFVFMIAAI